jgi:hypothetical protein
MARKWKIVIGILAIAVVSGLISFRSLRRRIERLSESQTTEEQARREVLAASISTPTHVLVLAKIFWAAGPDKVAPVEVQLPLSADSVQRSKQVLHELMANPPTADQRAIPADADLLGFYILPDGTAIADFSDALASKTPSGILSEQMAVDSIARTLENNVPALHHLKILIHGQEVDTLAGHVDLTRLFDLNPPAQSDTLPASSATPSVPGPSPSADGATTPPPATELPSEKSQ